MAAWAADAAQAADAALAAQLAIAALAVLAALAGQAAQAASADLAAEPAIAAWSAARRRGRRGSRQEMKTRQRLRAAGLCVLPCQRAVAGVERKKLTAPQRYSQAAPNPTTSRALSRLASEVERDPAHSTRYGRQRRFYAA